MGILGHRLDGDAANLIECGTPQDSAGATEKGRIPEVVAVLDDAVKEFALVGDRAELVEIALEWIGRIEVVGGLQHGQLAVTQEPAEGDLHEAARGDVVAVEDRHVGGVEAG